VSTYPESIFRKMRTVQLPTPTGRYILRDYDLTTDRGESVEVRAVHPGEIDSLLKTMFGIDPPSI
jgi:arylamine N-acetyltransferase